MPKRWKAIVLLMLLSPGLTELITGSTTLSGFVHPVGLLFLLLGYSAPALLIREWAVRYSLGYASVIALGVAFGIYNEGLWAKTIIMLNDLPIRQFDHYGRIGGINLPWAAAIGFYHALAAIVLPIAIVHALFPTLSDRQWLSKRLATTLTASLLLIACVNFLGSLRLPGTPTQLVALLAVMAVCLLAAWALGGRRQTSLSTAAPKLRAFFLGLSSFSAWLVLPPIAEHDLPLVVFFSVFAAGIVLYVFLIKKIGRSISNILLFGMGFYVQSALLALVIGVLFGSPERIVTGVAIIGILLYAALRLSVYRRHDAPAVLAGLSGAVAESRLPGDC